MVEQIEANTRQLQHSVLTLTSPPGDDTDNFETFFPEPIYAPPGRGLEIALNGLRTYRSWANVNDTNNRLVYSLDAGRRWFQIEIPEGAYELEMIEAEIHRQLESRDHWEVPNHYFTITANLATLKAIIDITGKNFIINMENSTLNSILGWGISGEKGNLFLRKGRHEAPNIVNITHVNEVLIHCDIVDGSYIDGKKGYVLNSFYPDVEPGYKIDYTPRHLVFLPVTLNQIQRIRCWLTDQENRPIKMRGELVTISCILRDKPIY